MTTVVLGAGWGLIVLVASARAFERVGASVRALDLRGGPEQARPRRSPVDAGLDRLGSPGRVARGAVRRRAARRRDDRLARELPAAVDLLAVAISAGATPFLAVATVARWAPPTVAEAFASVSKAAGVGASFDFALDEVARRDPRLAPLTGILGTGSRLGAAIDDPLARLAAESRRDLRRRAEARARTVPVRLLFPLVFLVLPAFGLLTVVPAVVAGFHGF